MEFQHIRNATIKITYGGITFLVDPWLIEKDGLGPIKDTPFAPFAMSDYAYNTPMPLVDLPMHKEDLLAGVNAYILTHIHPDHIDIQANGTIGASELDKLLPIFAQSKDDQDVLKKSRFQDVRVLSSTGTEFAEITIYATPGVHGTEQPCGPSIGLVLKAQNEPTVYIAGDTILYDGVKNSITKYDPDIIIVNACAAQLKTFGTLMMDDQSIIELRKLYPEKKIIAIHFDTITHATITREEMKKRLEEADILDTILIPEDGENYTF